METRNNGSIPRTVLVYLILLAAVVAGGAYLGYRHQVQARQRAELHITTWADSPKLTARLLMERYGPPDQLDPEVATWYSRGLWKRITVHGDSPDSFLEQVVGYRMPRGGASRLSEFEHGVRFDLDKDELSASSNMEPLNFLALNVANEVATGRRIPTEARGFYVRTVDLAGAGKSSPYMEKLMFEPYRPELQERRIKEIGY